MHHGATLDIGWLAAGKGRKARAPITAARAMAWIRALCIMLPGCEQSHTGAYVRQRQPCGTELGTDAGGGDVGGQRGACLGAVYHDSKGAWQTGVGGQGGASRRWTHVGASALGAVVLSGVPAASSSASVG